jgi:hypothetical protein
MRKAISAFGAVAILASALASGLPTSAAAETQADRDACIGDVMSLCSQFIPDRDKITACLRKDLSKLSPACHAVMTRPAPKN